MSSKAVVAVVAAVVIVVSGYFVARSLSPAEEGPSVDQQYWTVLAGEGFVECPHCKKTFELSAELRKSPKPPETIKCPECGKAFDPLRPLKPGSPAK